MRPVRLFLDGFGSYRQPAEADFSDVDFFALTGPTGSGKSTLIDGLCFALYGTVPRWRKENVIADALAPAANACRVCLVFEAGGKRYAAVRALTRDKKGQVHTKEARLDRLDPAVPPDASLADLLEASIEQISEGPDQVTTRVEDILGLSYKHFTQSVLLPQGRFSDFLQAEPRKRQDLLVELLAFGVYDKIGQRARERAKLAAELMQNAQRERAELASATEESETVAAARLEALTALASVVDTKITVLAKATQEAEQAHRQASEVSAEVGLLAAIQTPADVTGLATQIARADTFVTERTKLRDEADQAVEEADHARSVLPDKTRMETLRQAYEERRALVSQLTEQEQELAAAQATEKAAAEKLQAAEQDYERARDALAHAERAHAAVALAEDLHLGDQCPVCLQPVDSLPHHTAPADLKTARAAADSAEKAHKVAVEAHGKAARDAAVARGAAESARQQLAKNSASLAEAPGETEVTQTIETIALADETLQQARSAAAARRREASAAERERSALMGEEQKAWAALRRARDSVVSLGAPPVDEADLAAAWKALATWAAEHSAERRRQQPELEATASARQQRVTEEIATLTGLLTEQGIPGVSDPARAPAAVTEYRVRAENDLAAVRRDREKAAMLDAQIRGRREVEQVAAKLGQLLRATSFERWLCSEALDSLVEEASVTLMELSGGQYQLDRDDRNDLVVIDYEDAGARRPVHTLSGGETFQASLALALALSRQVVGLSAGMRDLNSMFLDEGFGTLDEDTLETVATTLERLAADSDRMVGVITHVAALAERVPVRFVVSHTGASSSLRKERV
jgi:DNA repair protein SbcC/Rad50